MLGLLGLPGTPNAACYAVAYAARWDNIHLEPRTRARRAPRREPPPGCAFRGRLLGVDGGCGPRAPDGVGPKR